jgi:hemolysin III
MDSAFINPSHHQVVYALPTNETEMQATQKPYIYPDYSNAERTADGLVHFIGVSGALIAGIALITLVSGPGSLTDLFATWVYAAMILIAFIASAAYHMTPREDLRPTFRRFDHAAIFLKIAGTYTPLVVLIGSNFSFLILGLVWATALYGVSRRLFYWSEPGNGSTVLYLALGWASLALAWPMTQTIPALSFWLVIIGGLTYTAGVIFYKWESLRFSNAIWHVFVVTASACHFFAIYFGELAKQGQYPF